MEKILILILIWVVLFISSLMYLNSAKLVVSIIKLDFKSIKKIELWISGIGSLIITILLYLSII